MKCRQMRAGARGSFPRLKIVVSPVRVRVSPSLNGLHMGLFSLAEGQSQRVATRQQTRRVPNRVPNDQPSGARESFEIAQTHDRPGRRRALPKTAGRRR